MSPAPHADLGLLQPLADGVVSITNHAWWSVVAKPELLVNLGWAAAILAITIGLSTLATNAVKRASRRIEGDRTLLEFFSQVVRWIIVAVGMVAVLSRLGVQTASLITVLGAASLAIGLALQGTLSNVAAGLMILFNKPYRIGDAVLIGDIRGTVYRLGLFATEVNTIDNIRVYIPNTKAFSNEIYNITTNGAMKLDVIVGLDYGTNLEEAYALLHTIATQQPLRVTTYDAVVGYTEFADSSINAKVSVWVSPGDVIAARTQLMMDIKKGLDAAAIEIPYPHQVDISKNPKQLEIIKS
ncbi:MAG: mechanosensitive ion channel domain-containing protein [Asticcacaulis sp.]